MAKATLAQGMELLKFVSQSGIEKDALQALLESGKFTALLKEFAAMAALIVGKGINVAQVADDMISLVVPVDRNRTPQKAIEATGRVFHGDCSVVKTMPAGGNGVKKVEVVFFNLGLNASEDEVVAEYARRGIEPDAYAVVAANEAYPKFADKNPNGAIWKDADGTWCFIAFGYVTGSRGVLVRRNGIGWHGFQWFGGVRK